MNDQQLEQRLGKALEAAEADDVTAGAALRLLAEKVRRLERQQTGYLGQAAKAAGLTIAPGTLPKTDPRRRRTQITEDPRRAEPL